MGNLYEDSFLVIYRQVIFAMCFLFDTHNPFMCMCVSATRKKKITSEQKTIKKFKQQKKNR